MDYKLLVILFIFVFGCYYYINSYSLFETMENKDNKEKMDNNNSKRCPNMLIEKDGRFALFNSDLANVPGVNPIEFSSLDEYSEFLDWQKSQNINCPVLYLQYTTDTQNNDLFQIKPSIFENSGGLSSTKSDALPGKTSQDYFEKNKMLDATLDSTPNSNMKFNTGMYSGFDQYNQNVGVNTPLDFLYNEKTTQSRNPMDPNWGGKEYTKNALQEGDYKGREVYRYNTPQIKTNFREILDN